LSSFVFSSYSERAGETPLTDQADGERKGSKKKRLWPWLLLLCSTLFAIYVYGQVTETVADLSRTWRDLVQLFWLIIPDKQPTTPS